jgi:hypothetical protein
MSFLSFWITVCRFIPNPSRAAQAQNDWSPPVRTKLGSGK